MNNQSKTELRYNKSKNKKKRVRYEGRALIKGKVQSDMWRNLLTPGRHTNHGCFGKRPNLSEDKPGSVILFRPK